MPVRGVLQCVAACCSVLQCAAMCCGVCSGFFVLAGMVECMCFMYEVCWIVLHCIWRVGRCK